METTTLLLNFSVSLRLLALLRFLKKLCCVENVFSISLIWADNLTCLIFSCDFGSIKIRFFADLEQVVVQAEQVEKAR